MSWQTELLALRLQRFIEHVVAETCTNTRAVTVYIPPEACRYIVETVIWEYENVGGPVRSKVPTLPRHYGSD